MIVSKSFCAAKWLRLCFCQLAFWLDIDSFHVIICRSCARLSSGFPPHIRISDRKYSTCWIFTIRDRAEQIQSLLTHLTPDKIIFRTTKIIRTLPRTVGRGEIGPKSVRLSCGVYPALDLHSSLEHKLRYIFYLNLRALRPAIDSKVTFTIKVQKRSKDIVKIVHVTSVVQP